ncbi:hypothetical protein KUTeg_013764 [Tegillarca granosa]|uniref:Uncharacterized protein n=1 Tax=Tegillarca granosa TaxID=220873 RepID=A0ABQ9EYG8_TEGGR|nr:hypothetical protein KUTeg_013764 [Tegillarca granosa]
MTPITEDEEDSESSTNLQKRDASTHSKVTLDFDGVRVIQRVKKTPEEEEADYDTDLELQEEKEDFDLSGRNLYLSMCKTFGVVPASYFLRHMKNPVLNLRHHGLAALGAKALSFPLMNNTSVLKLDLSDNWIEGEGAEGIASMLKENCYISNLDLSENHLGNRGAVAICNMLTTNTTLKEITLSGNDRNSLL